MRALDDVIVRRKHQSSLKGILCFLGEERKHLPDVGYIGNFVVVSGMLTFRHLEDVPICTALVPVYVLEMINLLKADGNAFKTVRDLDRRYVQNDPACLLEVGELGDFLAVQPDFPAKTPRGEGW